MRGGLAFVLRLATGLLVVLLLIYVGAVVLPATAYGNLAWVAYLLAAVRLLLLVTDVLRRRRQELEARRQAEGEASAARGDGPAPEPPAKEPEEKARDDGEDGKPHEPGNGA